MTNQGFGYSPQSGFILICCVFALVLGTLSVIGTGYAQSSPCPPTGGPQPSGSPAFAPNDTVYVTIDPNSNPAINDFELQQIVRGLNSWSAANAQNGSGVTFTTNPQPSEFSTSLLVRNGTPSNPAAVASFTRRAINSNNNITAATITLNVAGGLADPNNPSSGPYYDPNAPNPPGSNTNGYGTVFQKEVEHEIGHGMGLTDASGTDHESVMNQAVANCPNDQCNAKPTDVSPCDSSVVSQEPVYNPNPTPSPSPVPSCSVDYCVTAGDCCDGLTCNGGQCVENCYGCYYCTGCGGGYSYCEYKCQDYYTCVDGGDGWQCQYAGTDCEQQWCTE
jgi:hypothetical protein